MSKKLVFSLVGASLATVAGVLVYKKLANNNEEKETEELMTEEEVEEDYVTPSMETLARMIDVLPDDVRDKYRAKFDEIMEAYEDEETDFDTIFGRVSLHICKLENEYGVEAFENAIHDAELDDELDDDLDEFEEFSESFDEDEETDEETKETTEETVKETEEVTQEKLEKVDETIKAEPNKKQSSTTKRKNQQRKKQQTNKNQKQ